METGNRQQYLQYIVKHKSIPKLGVKDDNRELANGFGQFLTSNMHMNRYLELMTSLKEQMRALLDVFVSLTEEAILMVADRESAHFLRLYKTEFTAFLDDYNRVVAPALDANYIAPLVERAGNADRVLSKVEGDHTNALLDYRHYVAKLEKMGEENDNQKLLRAHEKLLAAAGQLTSATNSVYEEFNVFDDHRRKLIFDQTPTMFAAQRQLLHQLLEVMDRMDLTSHPVPPPNHYKPFHIEVPPCPIPTVNRDTITGLSLGGDGRPSMHAAHAGSSRHVRVKSSPSMPAVPLSPIARNRPAPAPWDAAEDEQPTTKKAFTLRRARDTAAQKGQQRPPAPPSKTVPKPAGSAPVTPQRIRPQPGAQAQRPTNAQVVTPIRTPLAGMPPPPPRPSLTPSQPPPPPPPKPVMRAPLPTTGVPAPARTPRPPPAHPPPAPPRRRASSAAEPSGPFARMPPPPPPVRRNSRVNDQHDALTAEAIAAVRAAQQTARRPSFDYA